MHDLSYSILSEQKYWSTYRISVVLNRIKSIELRHDALILIHYSSSWLLRSVQSASDIEAYSCDGEICQSRADGVYGAGWKGKISSPGLDDHASGNGYTDSNKQNSAPTYIPRGFIPP